jgi:glycosyltransferase involved in cell wall biosynthesis
VVDDGVNGLLVPRAEVGPLALALAQLVRDPAQRERFGKAGRLKAEAEFDERAVVDRLLAAYDELSARR